MKLVGDLRIVVLCALVWALLAAACLAMTVGLGAELPIWLPAGLSVAQFGLLPKQRWPLACAALGAGVEEARRAFLPLPIGPKVVPF